ncbi:MAG: hypothetical protein HBSAPP04_05990 [Ignavibacteriaceae bacterium]|nr:MAG: hypothetical protein HBSAPP04_05990 [Ignavibacteriaceae bacterium]
MASKVNLAETSVSILRTWFNFLPGMAYRCNNDHNWTMQIVSAGSFELTGYNPVDFIEQRVSYDTLILPEYREMVWKEIQNAVLERSHFTIEYRIKSKSGESKWVWEKGTGIFDDEGKLLFLEGYIADVTDRKEKEIELDTFFDIQPELLCISTRGGVFLKLNRAWEKKFGYGLDELIGESFKKLIHPDDLKVTVELDYITPDGVIPTFRNRYLTKDGKVVHLEWSAAIKDDKYYASARDISERVMLEKTITSRESLMRSMINSITESALLLETDGTIILCNRIAAERLGLQPEDLIKKNAFDLLPPDLAASRKERISEVIRTGSQVVFEDLRDGRAFLNSIYPVFDDQGVVSRSAIFAYDITERKETITRLEQATKELQELNDLKNKFISILAHDLRGPFHPLLSSFELLDLDYDRMTDEERRHFIRSGRETAVQLFELLESILSWSRLSQGMLKVNLGSVNVTETIVLAISQLSIVSDAKNILINFPDTRRTEALADPEMLLTTLRNLISNSIKFSEPGSSIDIAVFEGSSINIVIADYGRGIEPEKLKDIFKITKSRSTRGTSNETGSGMGLLLCKEMVNKMEGKIFFQSQIGVGTIATISLKKPSL